MAAILKKGKYQYNNSAAIGDIFTNTGGHGQTATSPGVTFGLQQNPRF